MATAFGTTASASAASSVANNAPNSSAYLPLSHRHFYLSHSKVSFRISPKPKLLFSSKGLQSRWNRSAVARAQLNEVSFFESFSLEELFSNFRSFLDTLLEPSVAFKVAVDGSSNATATSAKSAEVKDVKSSSEPAPPALASEESISQFMTQVASLVKLVDSRDIMELQLKQLDCELLIRKKEALPPPPSPAPIMMAPSHFPPPAAPAPTVAPAPVPTPAPAASPAAKSPKSSRPPLKCPMAGTLYRSPAPGEQPFVKVGDKVQKGQVVCIIEAMKLMNEIEADQSGTIVEVLAEDGKPVSVDTPLFVIEP